MDSTSELQPDSNTPPVQARVISGFWRRSCAFIIDLFLLGLVGWILSLFLSDFFYQLGPYAKLIGFPIALAYFGIFNSAIGHGRTLGKSLMKIEVVTANGEYISLRQSFLRYAVLGFPFFVTIFMLPANIRLSWIGTLFQITISCWGFSIFYFFIFNRRTRQSVHDFAVHTYVTLSRFSPGVVEAKPIWKGHGVILGILPLISVALSICPISNLFPAPVAELVELQKKLTSNPDFQVISTMLSINYYNGVKSTGYDIIVNFNSRPKDLDAAANTVATCILKEIPDIGGKDYLNVRILDGYDIGIWSFNTNRNFKYTLAEWQQRLNLPPLKAESQPESPQSSPPESQSPAPENNTGK